MALVPITHVYDTLSVINNTGLLDGQILYTTDQTVNKIFADVKVNNILRRIEIGGTNEIDTVLNQESGHAIANSAVAKLAQTVHTNFLNPTLGTTKINGVTCTANGDGTYTLTGTATGLVTLDICTVDVVEGVSYRLVGCPSGGSGTTYRMGLYTNESSSTSIIQDLGTGRNWASDRTATIKVRIVIQQNYAISGSLVFKPMLTTDLSATYDDYVQYSGNGKLNQNVVDLYKGLATANSRIGAQSLLPTPSQSVTQNINALKTEINQINSDLSLKLDKNDANTILDNIAIDGTHDSIIISTPADTRWGALLIDERGQMLYLTHVPNNNTIKNDIVGTSNIVYNTASNCAVQFGTYAKVFVVFKGNTNNVMIQQYSSN